MLRLWISILIIFILSNLTAYGQLYTKLIWQIDSLKDEDQKWRNLITQIINKEVDSISNEYASRKMIVTDSLNFFAVKAIFEKYGYPGFDLVGNTSSHNYWLIVQHMDQHPDFQEAVLEKMKIEAYNNNASLSDYAYLVDRIKVNTGQLQVYGTQMKLNKDTTFYEPKPVIDPDKLNDRRKSVGLPSIEAYIQTMNEHYHGSLRKK